ncbi:MAG TPA: UDP-N-acetylmuramoyl-L-alanyl-D-glutamate--2,6-diaminopimelate ligase [Candidatus Paceibacterota bacterium]|jgi:UDP-N-acetylmuramoyl-L-alanyl-D-glutamate--2,6-diaminopimelate ligase|nr:UDP-N-acetylmuramoyl-L-alanyl-D-glutamate--2,6-diaminopimelate ligase [Candidatus Paceibacterota bacterium]
MKNSLKNLKLKRRAIAAMASMHLFGNSSKKMKVIGVTGTNGKTTVATLLYRIAIKLGLKAGLISTVENLVNGEKMSANYKLHNAPSTTPDPIFLHKLLNKMAHEKCEYVFMEVTSHALDQDRVAGVHFAGGIFTNLTHDHLDYHGNIENYFGAKKKFFKMLPPAAFALSNADDKYGPRMLEGIRAKKYTYGLKSKSDFSEKLETKLIGDFNIYNALAAYAALTLLGIDGGKVKEVLKNIEAPRGRFEHFTSPNDVLVIVDYAHTPDALENVLKTVQSILPASGGEKRGKVISVFGCGGDRDPLKRPIMGKIGAMFSDIAIFTSDNPRGENPEKIIEEMKADLSAEELSKVKSIPDRREAILESIKLAQNGDIILCAGKGHEDYQEIKGVKNHFDDMEEYKKAF